MTFLQTNEIVSICESVPQMDFVRAAAVVALQSVSVELGNELRAMESSHDSSEMVFDESQAVAVQAVHAGLLVNH